MLKAVLFTLKLFFQASSDCTAIRLDVFPTTIIFTEPDFDPQSFAHSFLLTDGTMCVFASEYSILNVGVVSCTITQQTEMQHCLWIRGPGEFSLVSYSVQSAASALLAEEFTNLTILGLTYIDNIFATGVRNHLLTIRYGTSVSIANLEIKGYTNFTPDNGGRYFALIIQSFLVLTLFPMQLVL